MQELQDKLNEKNQFSRFLIRLGKISFNLSIVFLLFCLCGIISGITTGFILILGLFAILISFGAIFVLIPDYWNRLTSASGFFAGLTNFLLKNALYFVAFSIVFSILSIILLSLDKSEKHTARLVISSVVTAIALFGCVYLLIRGNL